MKNIHNHIKCNCTKIILQYQTLTVHICVIKLSEAENLSYSCVTQVTDAEVHLTLVQVNKISIEIQLGSSHEGNLYKYSSTLTIDNHCWV